MRRTVVFIGSVLVLELLREWFALRALGFEPERFVDWVKGE